MGHGANNPALALVVLFQGVGFQPNDNYHLYDKNSPINSIHTLEYGQYELVTVLGAQICGMLSEHFGVNIGTQIFTWAVILCVNGLLHRDQIYTQSFGFPPI